MPRKVIIEALAATPPEDGYRTPQTDHGVGVRISVSGRSHSAMAAVVAAAIFVVGISLCWLSLALHVDAKGALSLGCCCEVTSFPFLVLLYRAFVRWQNVFVVECRRDGMLTRRDGPLRWDFRPKAMDVPVGEILGIRARIDDPKKNSAVVVLRLPEGARGLLYELAPDDAIAIAREIRRVLPHVVDDGIAAR